VLESIYAIETTFTVSLEDVFDQVAITVSNLVNLPYAAVGRVEKGRLAALTQLTNNNFSHEKSVPLSAHPCGIVLREKKVCQHAGNLKAMFPEEMKSFRLDFKSYVGVPIFDKDGTLIGVICAMGLVEHTCNDFEVHSMEIFARYLGHEIEHEIMDDQLRAAGEMNLLGRIASGVAHEVRNPLNGILAISEALFLDIGDNAEHRPYLEHIKTQVNRLSLLMKDLLDLGKPLVRSEFTPQPLEQIIRYVIDSLTHSSFHKDRTVHFASSPAGAPPIVVRADPIKLQQVFVNLIENACDHSPDSTPIIIEMGVIANDEREQNAVVRVIDQGRGIAPDLLEKVFDPFFTTRKGGTGLGLSIVKHIVRLHGGSVSMANNTPSPGVTVEVRLPLYKQPTRDQA
jgi:signal transduction histidine kinase